MNLDLEALAGLAVACAGAGAALGKLGDTLWRRHGNSHRPPIPSCIIDPQQIVDVHRVVTAEDPDGGKRVWNKPSVETAIRTTALAASRQTLLLEEIRDLIRKGSA
jgi:hypothetical protein